MTTWTNKAGFPMAIADTAEEACALWQADLQAALDDGRMSIEEFDGEVPLYNPRNAQQIISDVRSYATDPGAPSIDIVSEAAEAGRLYQYA